MKTLKFREHLAEQIRESTKTATWRLFNDKELQTGDIVNFIVWESGKIFAEATLTQVNSKTLGDITDADYAGHESFKNHDDMIAHYKEYYGDRVNDSTLVKIIAFKVKNIPHK